MCADFGYIAKKAQKHLRISIFCDKINKNFVNNNLEDTTVNLLGKAHDPKFWEEVRESENFAKFREELFRIWEKDNKDYHPECLKYSEFKLFWTTGDRDRYQKPYFHRRAMAENAAMLAGVAGVIWLLAEVDDDDCDDCHHHGHRHHHH